MGIIVDISEVSPRNVIVSPGKDKDTHGSPGVPESLRANFSF